MDCEDRTMAIRVIGTLILTVAASTALLWLLVGRTGVSAGSPLPYAGCLALYFIIGSIGLLRLRRWGALLVGCGLVVVSGIFVRGVVMAFWGAPWFVTVINVAVAVLLLLPLVVLIRYRSQLRSAF